MPKAGKPKPIPGMSDKARHLAATVCHSQPDPMPQLGPQYLACRLGHSTHINRARRVAQAEPLARP